MFVCLLMADVVVDRSTTGRISGGFNGNWADGIAAQGTGVDPMDEKDHLAKVRVAGSNPVVRSRRKSRSKAIYAGDGRGISDRRSTNSLCNPRIPQSRVRDSDGPGTTQRLSTPEREGRKRAFVPFYAFGRTSGLKPGAGSKEFGRQ